LRRARKYVLGSDHFGLAFFSRQDCQGRKVGNLFFCYFAPFARFARDFPNFVYRFAARLPILAE
jgi:hypothetical protein